MTTLQPIKQLLEQLNIPAQDLAQLSFCDGTRDTSIKAWVRSLPLTQTQFISGLLYQALPDVSRFKTSPANRIRILEALRNPTLQSIEGLTQGFLNQPLILPEPAVKTATIAQALQKHMINGYLVAIRDLCIQSNANTNLLSLAIHRAISGIGLLLLRYYQLYVPISGQLWIELHSLYQLALHLDITEQPVIDGYHHSQRCHTITLTYLRTLLLACARPNQLRQDEIFSAFIALDELCALAHLQDSQSGSQNNLFAVSINSNRPPLCRSRFAADKNALLLELNTAKICKKLTEVNAGVNANTVDENLRNELQLTSALTSHLIQAWNILAQRNFDRQPSQGTLDVVVGLSTIHYHLSGKTNFTHFLNRTTGAQSIENVGFIFKKRSLKLKGAEQKKSSDDDLWDEALDTADTPVAGRTIATENIEFADNEQEDDDSTSPHPIYHIPLIDTCPGGYCIEWRDSIPNQVKAGELLGLRDPLSNRWSLGVVRWANQTKGATQLGIQILSVQVTPIGLAMIHKTGNRSEYLRALEIPALKAINQPATLITNAVSFREYSKAQIFHSKNDSDGQQHDIQLTRRLFGTGVFSQFTYRELNAPDQKDGAKKDDFDSIWDS